MTAGVLYYLLYIIIFEERKIDVLMQSTFHNVCFIIVDFSRYRRHKLMTIFCLKLDTLHKHHLSQNKLVGAEKFVRLSW